MKYERTVFRKNREWKEAKREKRFSKYHAIPKELTALKSRRMAEALNPVVIIKKTKNYRRHLKQKIRRDFVGAFSPDQREKARIMIFSGALEKILDNKSTDELLGFYQNIRISNAV